MWQSQTKILKSKQEFARLRECRDETGLFWGEGAMPEKAYPRAGFILSPAGAVSLSRKTGVEQELEGEVPTAGPPEKLPQGLLKT